MPIEITMPRLSDTMEEGTLIKWRVKVGDRVKNGDVLADVETDKATMELQSYDDGTVAKLAVQEGQTTPVGKLILLLAQDDEPVEEALGASGDDAGGRWSPQPPGDDTVAAGGPQAVAVATPPVGGGRVRVSPVAQKMAQEHGVDLASIRGSGPDGRIIKRDIQSAVGVAGPVAAPPPAVAPAMAASVGPGARVPAQSTTIPVSNMRKTIARRLVESKTTVPHFTVTVSVDVAPLLELRATLNTQLEPQGIKLSVNDFLVRAAALSLVEHPLVNSSWTETGILQHGVVHVGVAVALPVQKGGGLVVATIRDTNRKGVRQISAETRALAQKARDRGLSLEEMADGTFTISNLGMFQVEHFEAIINPPQAAILAVGGAVQKPVVRDGQIVVGRELTLTLSADHRVIDGMMAAEFLQTLRRMLENPAALLV